MATTTFNQTLTANYSETVSKPSVITRFMNWCKNQQDNRMLWVGIILAGHGCILTPITIMAVLLAGNSLTLFMLGVVAMMATLVTNLAAMPTKITIPIFILSLIIDIAVLIICITMGFNAANAF